MMGQKAGLVRRGKRLYWWPEERRVADKYARLLVQGRYRAATEAAAACLAELKRIPSDKRGGRLRPLWSVHRRLYLRARRLGAGWATCHWNAPDARVAARFADGFVRGEYSTVKQAARACLAELERPRGRARSDSGAVRTLHRVYTRLRRLVKGRAPSRSPVWTPAETRIMDRYLRDLYRGRFKSTRAAAEACARELGRRMPGRPAASRDAAGRHRATAVYVAMTNSIMRFRLPRYKGGLAPWELAFADRYARAVQAGKYGDCLEAARACAKALKRRNARTGRASPLSVGRLAGRPLHGIHARILAAAHRLGLRFNPRWSEAEKKVLLGWVRWYDRHRGRWRGTRPIGQASAGLQEELQDMGIRRSISACVFQLQRGRRRLHGVA